MDGEQKDCPHSLHAEIADHATVCALAPVQKKLATIAIKLLSSAGTGFFYTTRKNPTRTPRKLAFRKYDPIVRQHVLFSEANIKK